MDTIQMIVFAFDYSAQRLTAFNEALNQDELAKVEMENASRADALFTFKTSFTTVYTALGTLADGGDSKASSYHCPFPSSISLSPL